MIWFLYLLESLFVGIIIGLFLFWIKRRFKQKYMERWGGLIVISSAIFVILINPEIELTNQVFGILIGGLAILIFGLWDDFKKLSWKYQLTFQFFIALYLVWFGFEINHIKLFNEIVLNFNIFPVEIISSHIFLLGAFIFVFWIVAVINAINWLDGINGLSGTVSILALLAIFLVSLLPEVNQPAIAIVSLIVIGSILAFLIFNLIFPIFIAGTSGSYFFGFILATLAVISGTKIATLMLVIVFPLVDAVWVIFDRIKSGQSIFIGDKKSRHLHYRLLKLGWSEKKVVLVYTLSLIVVLVIDFYLENRNLKLSLLIFEIGFINYFMLYIYKKELKIKL